jgi:hypothetical protein
MARYTNTAESEFESNKQYKRELVKWMFFSLWVWVLTATYDREFRDIAGRTGRGGGMMMMMILYRAANEH